MKTYEKRAEELLGKRDAVLKEKAEKKRRAARIAAVVGAAALIAVITVTAVMASISRSVTPAPNVNGVTTDVLNGNETLPGITDETSAGTEADTEAAKPRDGVIEGSGRSDEFSYGLSKGGVRTEAAASPSDVDAYSPSTEAAGYPYENNADIQAGTLTAGEWKDSANFSDWKDLFEKQEWKNVLGARRIDTRHMIKVSVVSEGLPCFNTAVKLTSADTVLFTAKTDMNGDAYLFYNVNKDGDQPDSVEVNGVREPLDGKTEVTVNAAEVGLQVKKLDLMLMIDPTGSMGDELEYIKTELYDVVKRAADAGNDLSIRVSVNFYRDDGDEYIVKYYDFRDDVNECVEQLKEQYASGGGDYPEAVHTALDNAVNGHTWRDDAVKLCFFILDAPPHSESEIQGINEKMTSDLKTAAEQGIRIIPVASSGVDVETEYLMRSFALLTGGTYMFITDDSGIGGGHKEAEVGEHTVEYLNECMLRVICEYCGTYTGEKIPYTPTYHQ